MPALNSLVTQPGNTQPPAVQGTSGSDQASGAGIPMQGGQGGQGGGGIPQQQGMQPLSHQEATALLQHISFWRRRWAAMLEDPEAGEKNLRPEVYDLMADVLSDDYASLPEVMGLLKTMPTEPLEQKQWIEGHVQSDDQQMQQVLQHYAQNGPVEDANTATAQIHESAQQDRASIVNGAVSRMKAHAKKQRPTKSKGIPIRG